MGRLIDADKLKEVMSAAKDEYGNVAESFINNGGELSTEWYCVDDMVDNAETVEAIPVDWIKAYIEDVDAMPDKLVWGHDKNAILTMLRAWEVREEQKGSVT